MHDTKMVLWDWNGTLLDDVMLCHHLLNTLLERHGYAPVDDLAAYRAVFCFPISVYYQKAGFDFARNPFATLADEYMTLYREKSEKCTLQPHAKDILQLLQQHGIQQAILSASHQDFLQEQVAQYGILSYFDALVGTENNQGGSKIDVGRAWFEASGINPHQTVMIGDSVHDFDVAKALGTQCILYSGGHQPPEKLAATGAPVIQDLAELSGLLL
ncbi:MAG: HAD family hydrolase [Ruthenibacterium sp.]